MLRPEQMSRVSVTGSRRVMDDVIETVHGLDLLHVTEYDGAWEGFEPGDPVEGADEAAEKLVTVRSLQSILDVTEEDAGPVQLVDDEAVDEELEEIRQDVNELDDRRGELEAELRDVEDDIDTMEPFVDLGIDLDLLRGYETLAVAVGEGDPDDVRDTFAASEIDQYEVFAEESVMAVFARTDEATLQDHLVGTDFSELDVPDSDRDPGSYLDELHSRERELESNLDTVEQQLGDKRIEVAGFLLAAEEQLAIDVQKREAPLTFATTENAFIAEGWIPTEEVDEFRSAVEAAAGEAVDVDELERAAYDDNGHAESTEEVGDSGGEGPTGERSAHPAEDRAQAEGESDSQEAVADGGRPAGATTAGAGGLVRMGHGGPPTVQDNPGPVRPFESLVEVVNRPKYSELDPTVILFLTFPAFFGFMIGDLGYGLLYMGIGYWLTKSFDSDMVRSLGGVALWAGGFTALFGVLYGEFFGLHQLGGILWNGDPPIHKGLQPHYLYYAQAWLLVSVVVGILHMVIGWSFDFVENLEHGFVDALTESGSWIIATVGLWLWVFSTMATVAKPPFMFEVFSSGEGAAIPLGFTGFSPTVGWIGIGMFVVGVLMIAYAEGPGLALIESITQCFGHVVSYTRIAAVLLAKAGMALAVNLLVFGAYQHNGEFHLIFFNGMPEDPSWVIFSGLLNSSDPVMLIVGGIFGIILLVLGHLLVLVLGITSAGLQAVRLEYVEFFGKFYEGGGQSYDPFGYVREYTTED